MDGQFVYQASAMGLGEVNLGTIAAKQGSHAAVKRFGQRMVADHTKANEELIALANKWRLKVAPRMDAEHQRMADRLVKLSGPEFDREYIRSQIDDHKAAIALFEKEAREGKSEPLRQWANKALPILRDHLKMAEELHDKLEGRRTPAERPESRDH